MKNGKDSKSNDGLKVFRNVSQHCKPTVALLSLYFG